MNKNACASVCPSPTSLKLFTFCFYIGKNTYQELVRMLYVLLASLDKFHPDFFLVVYHNLGITIDDPRVQCRGWSWGDRGGGFRPPATDSVLNSRDRGGDAERLLLAADGCDGNVWVEGSAVRNRWHKLSFNKIHVFKNLYDEYDGVCFTWIDLDTIVLADLSYLNEVDNYFVMHGGAVSDRMHDVLVGGGGGGGAGGGAGGGVIWAIPERTYIQGSFWKLNLPLYHEVLRLDSLFRENGVRLKYDLQSIFAVMAWGGGLCPFYDGVSRVLDGSMLVIGENFMPGVMNGLGVWDTADGVGNHVNMSSLELMRWGGSAPQRRELRSADAVDIDRRLKLTADESTGGGSAPLRRVHGGGSAPLRRDAVDIDRRLKLTADESTGGEGGGAGGGVDDRLSFRTIMYPDKEIHILSLTFDSFFMSNVCGSSDFARLFPFLVV
jgi:hypothetical protein